VTDDQSLIVWTIWVTAAAIWAVGLMM